MKRSRFRGVQYFFLAALLSSPAWGSIPPQPGTINYIEGQAAIGGQTLNPNSVGSAKLTAGQSLTTANGRAEILLTPGIFLRVDANSAVQMVSPGVADTTVTLAKGRGMVEVAYIRPENNIHIGQNNANTQLKKAGLYDFDAQRGFIRVFDGEALVQIGGQQLELKSGHELNLNSAGKLKAQKFDKSEYADDFYRWGSLRSSYLAEANVNAARTYAGGSGWSPGLWSGAGWYWNPWYTAYTFIPGDGIFYDPFGWGFYSPWLAFGAPYFGFGYGYGYFHHFGPGYNPVLAARVAGPSGLVGHAYSTGRAGTMNSFSRGGFAGGGFRGGFAGGGGGFHGGGGGRR